MATTRWERLGGFGVALGQPCPLGWLGGCGEAVPVEFGDDGELATHVAFLAETLVSVVGFIGRVNFQR